MYARDERPSADFMISLRRWFAPYRAPMHNWQWLIPVFIYFLRERHKKTTRPSRAVSGWFSLYEQQYRVESRVCITK